VGGERVRAEQDGEVVELRPRAAALLEPADPDALLEAFYEHDYPSVVAAIGLVLGDATAACEAVDDAIAFAWQSGAAASDRPTFTSVVRARAVAIARRGRARRRLERRTSEQLRVEMPAARAVDEPLGLDVANVLATLSQRQREVVALHYLFDMPIEQVAHELGVSQSTVKTMLKRARALLMHRLGDANTDVSE
jgi:RNA polymerase sigma-70 factor (ECF subfamily)